MLNSLADHPLFRQTAPARSLDRTPLGFVDIGAQGDVHELVAPLARRTGVLGFEPDPTSYAALRERFARESPWERVDLLPVAIGAAPGMAQLHLTVAPTNSSLLRPSQTYIERYAMEKWRVLSTIDVPVISLDQAIFRDASPDVPWGELLKIDTQGTEHEILAAAPRTLAERTVAIFTEVSFAELYDGQRLFSEIEILLRSHGFRFYGFGIQHTRSKRLLDKRVVAGRERVIQADAIFFKDPLPLSGAVPERQLHMTFVAALLLGYADFAEEIALATWADGAEGERIRALVRSVAARSPQETVAAVENLARRVAGEPERANLLVGQFVDDRRLDSDYKDVPR